MKKLTFLAVFFLMTAFCAQAQSDKTIEITDANFEELALKSDKPVIIHFWATWCGPCKMLHPIIKELAGEMDGQAVLAKMDVQKNTTGIKYGVSALPTIIIFKGGQKVETIMGVPTKAKLKEKIQQYL